MMEVKCYRPYLGSSINRRIKINIRVSSLLRTRSIRPKGVAYESEHMQRGAIVNDTSRISTYEMEKRFVFSSQRITITTLP